jgi:signal transduction histidine kinase
MPEPMRAATPDRWKAIFGKLPSILVLIYEFVALAAFIAIPIFTYFQTYQKPLLSTVQNSSLYITYLVGLVYLLCSLWVFSLRNERRAGRMFSVFSTSIALSLACYFVTPANQYLAYLWVFALSLSGGALINLALIFPQEFSIVTRIPGLRWAGYLPSVIIFLMVILGVGNITSISSLSIPLLLAYIYLGIACLFFTSCLVIRRFSAKSPIMREQSRLILWGDVIAIGFLTVWLLLVLTMPGLSFTNILLVPILVFPIDCGYAILRYRLVNTDYLVSRAALYGSLTILTATAYALIVSGLSLVLGSAFPGTNPFVFGAVFFALAMLILPFRTLLQRKMDEIFVHGQAVYRERVQAFSRDLTQAMELTETIGLLRRYAEESLNPAQLHIFVHDALSDQYVAMTDDQGRLTSDLRFGGLSALVQALSSRRASLLFGEATTLPAALLGEKPRLVLLGAQLFIPLPGRGHLIGWLAVGPRRSGEPYVDQDLTFLETLCDQAALAVERAQVVENLERRMHEMNVLTRVSQGINITVAFDDILELIYAQTNQVIKTLDFRVTLHDSFSDYLYHVFYLDNDERFNEQENHPLPLGQGLEHEVVNSRRPIVTDDYERECRSRGVLPTARGVLAWMSVPLNAGAETIGVLSLGSRDPSVVYTDEQMNLLQAIADQAAGAIVKARLLQESERRTRQLTSLNEVARSLTSTLELDKLLNQILVNAVEILNCEAGSLLLIDNQTDELVFEVATGPVAADLMGKRLPPGTGLVGKAVETLQPIIANDVRRTKEWFDRTDQQTGFTTQDLLVVPMQVKGQVIGVIEVINRNDGLPFTQDDQELLAAFTSQAAVAIENARLYTLTDQALEARVEELSVMQRIDRELNASLDVEKTMRITLGWAMRQSKAEAGLVGIVEEQEIRVMASQGYHDELVPYKDKKLPLQIKALKQAVDDGQPQLIMLANNEDHTGLLESVQSQVAVPIRREEQTIGVIFLESTKADMAGEEALAFLSRLSDHATIAIANAKLYAEVEAANLAKSEFVSFVSHELKTPMTSIKGFTDLISSKVVGPVNETQANFLSTIRSNVDRMATLVSDLADISRIEAGRLRLDFGPVSVSEIIEEVTRSINHQIEDKQQNLTLQIAPELNPVWADRTRLIQILTNLVSNATKYSPQYGQINICAEAAQNVWDPGGTPKVIHISVQDTGFGITQEEQDKIFQKFFRSEDQAIRDAPGTGLGLNITRTLVEMQGGKIWFVTEFRKGTTFHFTVPVLETV